ncbi:hypothetical protein CE195_04440 [Sodalis-like symbiont of Philaenus spumarius]|nr:hypothetical protein CE195_04440 [Sodalis-like symbiont of Philaenus spumarius]
MATRYDKLSERFASFVAITAAFIRLCELSTVLSIFTCTLLLFDCVFQCFTRNKGRHVGSCDFDFFASLRIAASVFATMINFESAETN